jgi:multidrug efflux pump subunit AcrB
MDWVEQSKVLKVDVDQHKARLLGITTQDVANFLNTSLRGLAATSYREGIESIDVVLRADAVERDKLSLISELSIPTRAGKSVPLGQVATVSYAFEHGLVWRRNREPSISVRGQIYDGTHPGAHGHGPGAAAAGADPGPPARRLPHRNRRRGGGERQGPELGERRHAAVLRAVVLTVLMLQLRSFSRTTMVVLTAPLGLIGVVLFLLLFNKPFGFVAMLGTIALFGMIMRNSVILVDQIEQDVEKGLQPVGGHRRIRRAPLPPHRPDRGGGRAGHDSAVAQRLLRADGGGHHGRADRGHPADPAVCAALVCRLVPGEARAGQDGDVNDLSACKYAKIRRVFGNRSGMQIINISLC